MVIRVVNEVKIVNETDFVLSSSSAIASLNGNDNDRDGVVGILISQWFPCFFSSLTRSLILHRKTH